MPALSGCTAPLALRRAFYALTLCEALENELRHHYIEVAIQQAGRDIRNHYETVQWVKQRLLSSVPEH